MRKRSFCSRLRFHEPAHQKSTVSATDLNACKTLSKGMLVHPKRSQFAWKALLALASRCSSSTSNLLSNVKNVPSTLKPSFAVVVLVRSPLMSTRAMFPSSHVAVSSTHLPRPTISPVYIPWAPARL